MDTIERHFQRFKPVQPPERLRQRVLEGRASDWAVERAQWRRTLRWATAAIFLTFLAATWLEFQSTTRLARIQHDVEGVQREKVVATGLANVIPEGTDAALERYLVSQALAPPKPRTRTLDSALIRDLDAT